MAHDSPDRTWLRLRGVLADFLRHLVALAVGIAAVGLAINGVGGDTPVAEVIFGWLRIVGALAVVGVLAHLVPTWFRGVSLTRSSLLTLPAMAVVLAAVDHEAGWDAFVTNAFLGALLLVPAVLVAHVLRLVVPALRPHTDGKPVRYAMSGTGEPGPF